MIQGAKFVRWLADATELPERALVGGKAWSLARMASLGLRVPPAFVVTTVGFQEYMREGSIPDQMRAEILDGLRELEAATGRTFGSGPKALLLSVRSGAAISMPGMMDTVLNLGMTPEVERVLATESGDPTFARDTHTRFLDLFTDVVLERDPRDFSSEADLDGMRNALLAVDPGLDWSPEGQLFAAIEAVFKSWNSRRARKYRAHHNISDDLGTAVTVQAMVFGNLDENSGTGVLFSRNPLDGTHEIYGEYLRRAQGEDVVSGKVTPGQLSDLAAVEPELHAEIISAARTLEFENREIQDVEFTVQHGTLYLLQSRTAKLGPQAALRTSIDLVAEGLISRDIAIARISPDQAHALVAPRLSAVPDHMQPVVRGEKACAGVGTGQVVTDSDEAVVLAEQGIDVVLARPTTSPEDLPGMLVATAIVTETGGTTSHAAVVSRALGLPCVVGVGVGALSGLAGKSITVDGNAGVAYLGNLPVETPSEEDNPELRALIEWCRDRSTIDVVPSLDNIESRKVLDLDHLPGGNDPERVAETIRVHHEHQAVIAGGAAAAPEAIATAVQLGLETIVADPVLPVLLTAVQSAQPTMPTPYTAVISVTPTTERESR